MPEHILNRDVIVNGEHRKKGDRVNLKKSDAAYFSGHKISSEVVHRDTVNVPTALPPMRPAPVDDEVAPPSLPVLTKGGK